MTVSFTDNIPFMSKVCECILSDDGRVLKCINKGDVIETVIIEEIQVFENKAPVVNLKVHRDQGRLIAVSKHEIKSILLQRCHLQTTCR